MLVIPAQVHCCAEYFAGGLLPSPIGRGAGGEGSDLPQHFAPPEPSPGWIRAIHGAHPLRGRLRRPAGASAPAGRHPLPEGEGLTMQRMREIKSPGFVVRSPRLRCLESASWAFGYSGQQWLSARRPPPVPAPAARRTSPARWRSRAARKPTVRRRWRGRGSPAPGRGGWRCRRRHGGCP